MASNSRDRSRRGTRGSTAAAANRRADADVDALETGTVTEPEDDRDDDLDERDRAGAGDSATPRPVPYARAEAGAGGFFDIYRPGQGGRVRMGTLLVAGLFIVWSAAFTYEKLSVLDVGPVQQVIKMGIPLLILLSGGLVVYWLLTKKRGVIDFLIATEGEMKKVNWSTRKEVFGSTKVVIFVMMVLAVILFVVDLALLNFVSLIKVLRFVENPLLLTIVGGW